jgi:hypothetical protein
MALVELARFQTKVEADLAVLVLEQEGIACELFDVGMNYIGLGPIMPIRLMVLDSDADDALRVLADEDLL